MDLTEKRNNKERIYSGKKLNLDVVEVSLPNGKTTKREIVERKRCSVIFAIHDENVIVEEQFRQPFEREVFSLPAGKADEDETPLETAKREFEEETGYISNDWIFLGEFISAPAYSTEIVSLFFADNISKGDIKRDEDEFLNIYEMTLSDFKKAIDEGKIKDARSILAYYRYIELIKNK